MIRVSGRNIVQLALVYLALAWAPSHLIATEQTDFTIRFAAGEMTPSRQVITSLSSYSGHFLIQFDHPLSDGEKVELEQSGIRLIEYIPELCYVAVRTHAERGLDISRAGLRWAGKLTSEQKLSSAFLAGEIPEWTRRSGDSIQITVAVHRDVEIAAWAQGVAQSVGARLLGSQSISNAAEFIVPKNRLLDFAGMDEVAFVQPCLPFPVEHNDGVRVAAKVDSAQIAPYSLTGSGEFVAMWDGGRADGVHTDLTPRVVSLDASAITSHATHVAGTILGSGAESAGTYKGMAPSATLLTRLWWNTSSEMVTHYTDVIDNYSARISNNSWGVGLPSPVTNSSCAATLGNYFVEDATIDNIVRGDAGAPMTIVWSAGNMRSASPQYCGSIGWTYNTVDPLSCSKNVICVGAVISNDNTMSTFSGWGPTDDGRVKPDICAPGCQIGGDNGVTSTKVSTGYAVQCGTSMAAPVVSGVVALLQERWNQLLPSDNLAPATIKGILINSATDKGPVGPDYQYGHGVLNAVAAVRKVSVGAGSYVEASMITGVTHDYAISIAPGVTKIRATLVWDDPGGTAISGNALINDLDLKLIDPIAVVTLPWVLSPGNPSAAATRGADHKNNVETAELNSPTSGVWHAQVSGFNVPNGPQKYSLVVTPDSSNATDTARAVDSRASADISGYPGDTLSRIFWAVNNGGGYDSVRIRITDSLGWQLSAVDSTVWLAPFDSTSVSVQLNIPPGTLPGVLTRVNCLVNSQGDTLTTDSSSLTVTTLALYRLSASAPVADTALSPETIAVSVRAYNTGNVTNAVQVNILNDSGWSIAPSLIDTILPAGDSALLTCQLIVPAEVPDGAIAEVTFAVSGENSSTASAQTSILIQNPFPPPHLRLPDTTVYFTNRAPEFVWTTQGTSYRLVVASDTSLLAPVRSYAAIIDTSFDMPLVDSLSDGIYYWGVKAFGAGDSSSFQRFPRTLVIDNLPPPSVSPLYPLAGQYPQIEHFQFNIALGPITNPVHAPEYNVIELAQDSLFGGIVTTYQPISSLLFTLPDLISEGRWYWRVKRIDSAGNGVPFSSTATFVLDTTAPPTPTILRPRDTSLVGGSPQVVFAWTASPTFPHESSPDYYHVVISTIPDFSTIFADTTVLRDTVIFDRSRFTVGDTLYWKVTAGDSAGWMADPTGELEFRAASYVCGDMDSTDNPDISDLTALIAYLYLSGPPLVPPGSGSVDCDEGIDISDLSALIGFLYLDGPPPCCY